MELTKNEVEELVRIRKKCLDSKDPLRFISYYIDEKEFLTNIKFNYGKDKN
jgi:hypothetical protein